MPHKLERARPFQRKALAVDHMLQRFVRPLIFHVIVAFIHPACRNELLMQADGDRRRFIRRMDIEQDSIGLQQLLNFLKGMDHARALHSSQ